MENADAVVARRSDTWGCVKYSASVFWTVVLPFLSTIGVHETLSKLGWWAADFGAITTAASVLGLLAMFWLRNPTFAQFGCEMSARERSVWRWVSITLALALLVWLAMLPHGHFHGGPDSGDSDPLG